ncbi:hypothetical protein QSJ18_04810 [Gordonia sp. ABSL1-1]|uniref:hypothetical protein n=1 Tax=Gordonia sp. ABSL1-1 TaxID=3053923 RepID=UPI002574073B|nr:hypothetical protein [Gordonia sp. ABSL1-1]MDL9936053.1 hypothetical protein [Gordonia sp. ABSL1-1]
MNPTITRRVQFGLLIVGVVITAMSFSLIGAAFRNDATINESKGTVMADVVSADARHAQVYFQTPDGRFHSPKLGLLYPTELSQNQRIRVEYAMSNPDLARPAGRSATLAIIPGLSIAVTAWLIVGVLMVAIAELNRFLARRATTTAGAAADDPEPAETVSTH